MFDQISVILFAFTGKLKQHPTLRKYFWAYLAAVITSILVLAYNSFMSLNYYRGLLERFTPWESDFLPILVTVIIALTAYWLIVAFTSTVLDYVAGREEKTEGHLPMFLAVFIGLCLVMGLDIYANLNGVDYVARSTTQGPMANPLPELTASALADREKVASIYAADISAKEEKLAELEKYLGDKSHVCNKVGCEKGVYNGRTGAPHWMGVFTPYGHNLKTKYLQEIEKLRSQKARELAQIMADKKTNAARDSVLYHDDQARFTQTVEEKQNTHTGLVWFAYGLAFVLSFFTGHYTDKALGERVAESAPGAPSGDRKKRHSTGRRTRSKKPAIGFSVPWGDGDDQEELEPWEMFMTTLQELNKKVERLEGSHKGINTGSNTGLEDLKAQVMAQSPTKKTAPQASRKLSPEECEFLARYWPAVEDYYEGELSHNQIAKAHDFSKSTGQKIKLVMKSIGYL